MITKGYNKALSVEKARWTYEKYNNKIRKNRPCVFISHQHGDKPACRKIAEYIKNAGLDIFFDEEDEALQVAVQQRDPFKITARIKEGIRESSHMLCAVSKSTEKSRWVPFEIGYGHAELVEGEITPENRDLIKVATVILKDLSMKDLPEYMQVTHVIEDIESLNQYIATLENKTIPELINLNLVKSYNNFYHPLKNVMEKIR